MIQKRIVEMPNTGEVTMYFIGLPKLKSLGFNRAFLVFKYDEKSKQLDEYIKMDSDQELQFIGTYTMNQDNLEILMEYSQLLEFSDIEILEQRTNY